MRAELLRSAVVALDLALEARTVEFQARHTCDARMYYERARLALQEFAQGTKAIRSAAARLIATQAAFYEAAELATFEVRLVRVEDEVVRALDVRPEPGRFARLFAD
jgi:hypothetical protein